MIMYILDILSFTIIMASLKSSIVSFISSGIYGASKFANDSVMPALTPLYDYDIISAAYESTLDNLSDKLPKRLLSGICALDASAKAFSYANVFCASISFSFSSGIVLDAILTIESTASTTEFIISGIGPILAIPAIVYIGGYTIDHADLIAEPMAFSICCPTISLSYGAGN
jgi:hypothetical protein